MGRAGSCQERLAVQARGIGVCRAFCDTLGLRGTREQPRLQMSDQTSHEHHQTLAGSVERVTYHNEQNGYTVLRLHVAGHAEPVTVTGNFSTVSPGESLRLTGWWTSHPQYGDQFKALRYEVTRPATIAGIQKYLGSGLIKGVGPVTAKRIVEHFGDQTLEVIEQDIGRLIEVKGVARKRVEMIQKTWQEQRAIKEVMLFLQSHSVSTHLAVKIYKQYGNDAITVVEKTPYRLAAEVYGIGFKTADQIARSLGLAVDAEERLRAGLQHVLGEATEQGHCYLPRRELILKASEALGVEDLARLDASLGALLDEGQLKIVEPHDEPLFGETTHGDDAIYLPPLWQSEKSIARRLRVLLERPVRVDEARVNAWLGRFAEAKGVELSDEQQAAIRLAAKSRVMVLTGGPGSGKTTTLRALVALFNAMRKVVVLASPTGRAAQRLSEVTGEEAKTLHRLLEFDPSAMGFKHGEETPLRADVIVVDEASMLDVLLANSLLKAVHPLSQLILVGDVDQLPSVGPGTVLRDLIDSGVVPVARLTKIFRQAAESLIIQNAHRINRGEFPVLVKPGEGQSDCYFIEAEEPQEVADLIVNVVSRSLPRKFGYDPVNDIQVLAPMNRGQVGANNLNVVLQQALNPPDARKDELGRGGRVLRVGDKVIQKVNNYKLDVFNGDVGIIDAIDLEDQMLAVRFGDRAVSYDYADVLELGHAFAVSIHKSQGSEYPAVIVPLHMQHFMMLSRNLVYTALTRAKKTVVLIGTTKAIGAAMRNVEAVHRFTGLVRELSQK
jgi:exodeoxyribonuclease V alpha subunit